MKIIGLLAILLILATSCQTTHQDRKNLNETGFLKDYSILKEGDKEQAAKIYIDRDAQWTKYNKIIIEPITLWADKDSKLREVDKKEMTDTLSLLHAELRKAVQYDFSLTDIAAPDTLRLRVALTDGQRSTPVFDTISTVVPIGLAVSFIKRATLGTHLSVGNASIEAELTDSSTGKVLIAAMDARAGTKAFKGKFDSWGDIKSAFQVWSQKLSERLMELGAGK